MDNNKLLKVSSITKKLFVGLLGVFLMVFLLFHMTANLFILAKDSGAAYTDFCHFMGSNIFIKIFEVVLLGCFLLHIFLSCWLWLCNRKSRPVGYHRHSRTKTATGSKLAIVTGSLLFVCLLFHFYDFYFVKVNFVEGKYMVSTDELLGAMMSDYEMPDDKTAEFNELFNEYVEENRICGPDDLWLFNIDDPEKEIIEKAFPNIEFEPDFYSMARQKFSVWHIVLCYLVFFFIVGFHIRHGFESAFQTFGLNHYKYSRIVKVLGIVYSWVVCIGFAIVPICVFLGL